MQLFPIRRGPMFVFVCARCDAELTAPLSQVSLPAHARQKYGKGTASGAYGVRDVCRGPGPLGTAVADVGRDLRLGQPGPLVFAGGAQQRRDRDRGANELRRYESADGGLGTRCSPRSPSGRYRSGARPGVQAAVRPSPESGRRCCGRRQCTRSAWRAGSPVGRWQGRWAGCPRRGAATAEAAGADLACPRGRGGSRAGPLGQRPTRARAVGRVCRRGPGTRLWVTELEDLFLRVGERPVR